jgi:hypothetical protein
MSKIKDLKNNPESTFNIIELLMTLMPVKKSKYAELLYNVLKNNSLMSQEEYVKLRSNLITQFNISMEDFEGITPYQLIMISKIASSLFSINEWKSISKFCEYNERGLVERNDVSTYKTMKEITDSVNVAQIKVDMKEMEKYIKKILDDGEWIVIRPLTYQSALKYGYGTKWCTSSDTTTVQFEDYSKRGILIYCINIKTGVKVAMFKELRTNGEFSFWNMIDTRIDSMQSGLPVNVLTAIQSEIDNCPRSNAVVKREVESGLQINTKPDLDTNRRILELSHKLKEARQEGRQLGDSASITPLGDALRRRLVGVGEEFSVSSRGIPPELVPETPISVREDSKLSRFLNGDGLGAAFDNAFDNVIDVNMENVPRNIYMSTDPATGNIMVSLRDPASGVVETIRELSHNNVEGFGNTEPSIEVREGGRPYFNQNYIDELDRGRIEE